MKKKKTTSFLPKRSARFNHVFRSRLFEVGVCDDILRLCLVGVAGRVVTEGLGAMLVKANDTFVEFPEVRAFLFGDGASSGVVGNDLMLDLFGV